MDNTEYFACECGALVQLEHWEAHSQLHQAQESEDQSQGHELQTGDEGASTTESFIECIRQRPPLWDSTLPLSQRSRTIKDRLWMEVFQHLNGAIELQKMETKFKNLKDTYFKCKNYHVPSGSGVEGRKKTWKYFQSLEFLSSVGRPRNTKTNFHTGPSSEDLSTTPSPSGSTTGAPSERPKKKQKLDADAALLEIIKAPIPTVQSVSVSPAMQTIDTMLKQLPVRIRHAAELEFINRVYSLVAEHNVEQ